MFFVLALHFVVVFVCIHGYLCVRAPHVYVIASNHQHLCVSVIDVVLCTENISTLRVHMSLHHEPDL